ncbi:hypothetical protein J9537_01070 [Enterococcus raffinosus]|uniref:hypothetical protein n=1 Tax=Enterococcus raffinosus TaxID=71452 RepID=UPI001C474B3C|nr:hypothetical protein [Enterococcus raffinosus]QXJ59411.1 hypothetical protein J9537_01070 [Enterococcus raffinosus]
MAYEKQTWISYDDNKTEEENIETGAVVTAERMNHIEDGVEAQATKIEFDAHLDDKENPHEVTAHQVGALTAEETSANVIYQAIGKETVKIPIILDFEGKIASSVIENPHKATAGFSSVLPVPSQTTGEVSQNAYNALSTLDGNVTNPYTAANKDMTYFLIQWNIVEGLTRVLGVDFFRDQGASTTLEKVRFIRSITKKINPIIYGRGSSVGGNKLSHKRWFGSWESGGTSTTSSSITKLELPSENENTINSYIQDSGFGSNIVYAEASDGTTLSTVIIDYACLELTIELSLNQYFKTLIAAYYEKNLGNVDNYETATQVDAESGTATDKFMTPLRTKQHVSSRIASQTEAESGTATEKLMTPQRVKQQIDKRIASQNDAEVGESSTKLATPLNVKQHFDFNLPDSLKSLLNLKSGTLAITGGNTGSLNWVRIGNLVFCMVNSLNGRGGGGLDSSIGSMPFKAKKNLEFLLTSDDRSALNSAQLSIDTDGAIRWKRSSNFASSYHGMFFFEVQE